MAGTHQQTPNASKKGESPAPKAGAVPDPVKVIPAPQKGGSWEPIAKFLRDDIAYADIKADESGYQPKHKNLVRLIRRQSITILFLVLLMIVGAIMLQPISHYYIKTAGPDSKVQELVSLTEPNLTDQAVLSWVATSITEILTFGFGDIDQRIVSQSSRFTKEGWDSFVDVLRKQNLREEFKMRQLVLTTVPANVPVIVAKGLDEDGDSTWIIEMPVIRTYSTNNNVTSGKRGIVRLTIARIPSLVNKAGIGIKMWKEM